MFMGKCKDVFSGIFWLGGGVEKRGICCGKFPSRNLSGKKIFMKGVKDFLALIKKNKEKIKHEKVISTESKEKH